MNTTKIYEKALVIDYFFGLGPPEKRQLYVYMRQLIEEKSLWWILEEIFKEIRIYYKTKTVT
jgi:hypothetical protein